MEFLKISIDIIGGYLALLLLIKLLGKTQLSQITAFDFISALVLGELVGNALFDDDIGLGKILFGMALWGALVYTTEQITQKIRKTRTFLEGGPSIIINKGKINFDEMKKNHLDLNQLQHLLRSKDIFSVQDCEYGILETDGTLSVIKKTHLESVTRLDLSINTTQDSLPITLILDGEVIKENLDLIGWTKEQLLKELKMQNVKIEKDVLIAEWIKNKPLYIQTYNSEKNSITF